MYGKVVGTVRRHRRRDGAFWWLKRAHPRSSGRWQPRLSHRGRTDGRIRRSCAGDSPGQSTVEPGLATISGWAYSGENDLPEGIVEASLDQDEDWVVLTNREPLEGIETSGEWNSRCDFHTALNTFSATACIDCV